MGRTITLLRASSMPGIMLGIVHGSYLIPTTV